MKKNRARADQRWTVMFIGDHGKVITLKRFKLLVVGFAVLFLAAVAVAGVLFITNQKLVYSNRSLKSSLEASQDRLARMREETDLLMTRIALAEAQVEKALSGGAQDSSAGPAAAGVDASESPPAAPMTGENSISKEVAPVAVPPEPAAPPQASEAPPPEAAPEEASTESAAAGALMVEIEKMTVVHRKGEGALHCEFKLRNVSAKPQRLTGHVVVVLKGDNLQPDEWMAMPGVELVDGRPSGTSKGYTFAIRNWRTMRLKAPVAGEADRFTLAEVYVFSDKGELWLREVQPITVQTG